MIDDLNKKQKEIAGEYLAHGFSPECAYNHAVPKNHRALFKIYSPTKIEKIVGDDIKVPINESRIANKMEHYSTSITANELAYDLLAIYQKAKKELADKSNAAAYREAIAHIVIDALPSEYYQVAKKFVES